MLRRAVNLIFLLLAGAPGAHAAEIVFLVGHQNGQVVQLEPDGQFFHVAIRYRGKWLHAHPHAGVELVDSVLPYGDGFMVMRHDGVPEPDAAAVAAWLGKSFDRTFRWDSTEATYCTRLVAELLGIPPRPMQFTSPMWEKFVGVSRGGLGLSPDELAEELFARGFRPVKHCERALEIL